MEDVNNTGCTSRFHLLYKVKATTVKAGMSYVTCSNFAGFPYFPPKSGESESGESGKVSANPLVRPYLSDNQFSSEVVEIARIV